MVPTESAVSPTMPPTTAPIKAPVDGVSVSVVSGAVGDGEGEGRPLLDAKATAVGVGDWVRSVGVIEEDAGTADESGGVVGVCKDADGRQLVRPVTLSTW